MARTFDEILKELNSDDAKVVQSAIDKRITGAIKTYSIQHPQPEERLAKINERIANIEKAKLEREAQFDLKVFAIEECYAKGVKFEIVSDLLPLFKDKESLGSKIDTLAQLSKENDLKRINDELANNSYKPGGGSHSENDPLDRIRRNLPPGDLAEFDKTVNRTRR
jgi:enolase